MTSRCTLFVLVLTLCTAGCDSTAVLDGKRIESVSASEWEALQKFVTRDFIDAQSAIFRSARVSFDRGPFRIVCGEVNAKNTYGGYVGFRRFAAKLLANGETTYSIVESSSSSSISSMLIDVCNPELQTLLAKSETPRSEMLVSQSEKVRVRSDVALHFSVAASEIADEVFLRTGTIITYCGRFDNGSREFVSTLGGVFEITDTIGADFRKICEEMKLVASSFEIFGFTPAP